MDLLDRFWLSEHQHVVVTLYITMPVFELLTAELLLFKFAILDHGAHRTIK